jgi:hypothetical protein
MSPPWSAPLTWEDHCKPHLIVFGIFSYFSRWGTRYDHGNDEVRRTLLDFAEEKLLYATSKTDDLEPAQLYAVLSQRLALDTHTPQYLFYSANPLNSVKAMRDQIANHMRVCVAIEDGIESLRGIASSEPVLSEAASRIMLTKKFSLPGALSRVLSGYCINQGDRGELIVASFFTWARDQVVKNKPPLPIGRLCPYFSVLELFQQLFTDTSMLDNEPSLHHSKDTPQSFGTVFKNAMMHFNHLIKPQEQKTLARPYLLHFMARGAAALSANCQPGFDAVYPYLYGGIDLDINKVGFIIVQVKNDSAAYGAGSLDDLFSKMDPFYCRLVYDIDKEDGRFPIPIIRIVFLLSVSDPYFKQHKYISPSQGAATLRDGRPLFTSYDYVCAGVSPDILRPPQDSPSSWATLVNKRDGWSSFYDVDVPSVLRSQLPGNASHNEHYTSWSSGVSLFERCR